ncbi:MAG: head-tail joining protein [Candidatus Competibacteraceae bacterium]
MSQLDAVMAQAGLPALRRVLGDAAVYTPPYTAPALPAPVSTWAMLRKGSTLVGQYSDRLETRLTAQLPTAEVPHPVIGATLTINSVSYRIDQVQEETAYFITVALRVPT